MEDFSETSAVGVWGWDHAVGDSLNGNGPPTKREGGVLGDCACGGLVEGMISSGEFSLE